MVRKRNFTVESGVDNKLYVEKPCASRQTDICPWQAISNPTEADGSLAAMREPRIRAASPSSWATPIV
jgi:hypothetical protein